ncbi:MAG TPA: hypothetical protein ENM97_02195 [Moorella mulderi]|nr:hypothetical protein [Moorella mulderi]
MKKQMGGGEGMGFSGFFNFLLIISLVFIPYHSAAGVDELRRLLEEEKVKEKRIFQDILQLDAQLQKLGGEREKQERELSQTREGLRQIRLVLERAEGELKEGRVQLFRILRFCYVQGPVPFLLAPLLSSDWNDFLINWELTKNLAGYFHERITY